MPTVVGDSRSSINTDPLRNFKFVCNINKTTSAGNMAARLGFMSISGLSSETSVVAYREGQMNTTPQKSPGQTDFPALTFGRGFMVGKPDMLLWWQEFFTAIAGTGSGGGSEFRADIDIYLLAHPWTKSNQVPVKAHWHVYNTWPSSHAFGDLDAGGNAIVMEQFVLQHEGFGTALAPDNLASDVTTVSTYL